MDAATKSEASGLHSALRYKFIALVGNEYVRAATAADAVARAQPKLVIEPGTERELDRKSTRLNSSHSQISYAVFCLKKKKTTQVDRHRHSRVQEHARCL